MLTKLGVDVGRLKRNIRRSMPIIDQVFKDLTKSEAILTSTYEGDHDPGSLHYCDEATDYRIGHLDMAKRDEIRLEVKKRLAERFGQFKYDVLFSANDAALHVEYDPK